MDAVRVLPDGDDRCARSTTGRAPRAGPHESPDTHRATARAGTARRHGAARDGTAAVENAGLRLPQDVAESAFEPFRSGAGATRPGLSIASWVAHAHGGGLTAGRRA
ncbi:hypothetical protein [Streptomyces sp. NPDC056527]|uniref:hypothetical protein n=1 Tax=Streptomyces sp. NPDC056527 TaxID=3345853 RepID=UPI00369C4E77